MESGTMGVMKETQSCRCLELEERVFKAEKSYINLESKMQSRIKEIESLESEKLTVEQEAKEVKRKLEKLVEAVRKLSEICALRGVEYELDENVKLGLELASIKIPVAKKEDDDLSMQGLANHQISGSPCITTPVKDYMSGRNRDNMSSSRVNKMLVLEGDSETEEREEKESDGKDGEEYEDEEDVEACEVDTNATLPGRKRKRVITSDSDNMSRMRRDKKRPGEKKWEYLANMRADFDKDPELCMRAVCVLYWFQTEGEKATRSTYVANGRGFSMSDAERGTRIGEFLTDGDPSGDLKKSVEELQSFEYNAVEICRDLARGYPSQLFQIYKNREVPFFSAPPSP